MALCACVQECPLVLCCKLVAGAHGVAWWLHFMLLGAGVWVHGTAHLRVARRAAVPLTKSSVLRCVLRHSRGKEVVAMFGSNMLVMRVAHSSLALQVLG